MNLDLTCSPQDEPMEAMEAEDFFFFFFEDQAEEIMEAGTLLLHLLQWKQSRKMIKMWLHDGLHL